MQAVPKNEIQKLVLESVNEFVDYIKATYGPAENKVLLKRKYHSQVIDDGVSIAREYESDSEAKNAIISIIREVATRTNDRVGDGTTSSLIMLQAIMHEISKSNKSPRKIIEELNLGLEHVKVQLHENAKKITTKAELRQIAKISFNNNEIADLIASLVYEVGSNGLVNVDDSNNTGVTTGEKVEGLEINSGYASPYFVNNDKKECVLHNPFILITDFRFTSQGDLLPLMEKVLKTGKGLLIVAERVEGDALKNLLINNSTVMNPETKALGAMNLLVVNIPPGNKEEFINDLATITGGETFTVAKGADFDKINLNQLGRCDKIVAGDKNTVLIGSKGSKSAIKQAITSLSAEINLATSPYEKESLERRLAKFTNGVAVIKVGAPTENEQKALKAKVDDAVNAVKVAYRGGVVCGAGLALARLVTSSPILNKALKYPFQQLKENSDIEINLHELKSNEAVNAVTYEKGDYLKLGIIDPVEVLIAGVESAVSIASLLISLKGALYETEKKGND